MTAHVSTTPALCFDSSLAVITIELLCDADERRGLVLRPAGQLWTRLATHH